MVELQEANLLKVDICRGRGVQVKMLGKEKLIHDQRGTGTLYKACGELRIPDLSARLLCPSRPVPFSWLVLTTIEARVTRFLLQ